MNKDNIINILKSKNFLIFVAVMSVLLLVSLLFNFTLLEVSVDTKTKNGKTARVSISKTNDLDQAIEIKNFKLKPGSKKTIITKTDRVIIQSKIGQNSTKTKKKLKPFRINKVKQIILPQKESQKIYSNGEGCAAQYGDRAFSYNCFNGSKLTERTNEYGLPKEGFVEEMTGVKQTRVNKSVTVKDGFLILVNYPNAANITTDSLFLFKPASNKFQKISLTSNLAEKLSPDQSIQLLASSDKERMFIRTKTSMYEVIDGKVINTPLKSGSFSISSKYSASYKKIPGSSQSNYGDADETLISGTITVYNRQNKIIASTVVDGPINKIQLFGDNIIVEQNLKGLIYNIEKKGLVFSSEILSLKDFDEANGQLVYISDRGVYRTKDDGSAALIYQEKGIKPQSVRFVDGAIHFEASMKFGAKVQHNGFRLLDRAHENENRVESLLNIIDKDPLGVTALTYNKNYINARTTIKSYSAESSTKDPTSYDQVELEMKKNQFIKSFKDQGFNPEEYNIKVYPGQEIVSESDLYFWFMD